MISFAPGPVPQADFVRAKLGEVSPHHRSAEFKKIFTDTSIRLQRFFETRQPVVTLTATGTGAMEAITTNLLREGEEVLVVVNGVYGEQWASIAQTHRLKTDILRCAPGRAVTPAEIKDRLQKKRYAAVFVQACETSTGVLNPIQQISETVREAGSLICVDACSSLGAAELKMDDWKLDAVLTSSQKVLMSPPGLSFVALSDRAWIRCRDYHGPTYFDLLAERDSQTSQAMARFTPGVSSMLAVSAVLERLESGGAHDRYRNRMIRMQASCARLAVSFGLGIFPDSPAPTLCAIQLPPSIDGAQLRDHLLKFRGIFVLGGFGDLAPVIIRLGLMGAVSNADLIEFWLGMIDALEDQNLQVSNQVALKKVVRDEIASIGDEVWSR